MRTITTLIAGAVLASLASALPAAAEIQDNGYRMNGRNFNGKLFNGCSMNGKMFNGLKFNGLKFNGAAAEVGSGAAATYVDSITLPNGVTLQAH